MMRSVLAKNFTLGFAKNALKMGLTKKSYDRILLEW